jgi:anthranilate phosphoribosyltransferase
MITTALAALLEKHPLDHTTVQAVMQQIMTGHATPAQIAGFLVALRMKGETVTEIAAAAQVMRDLATPLPIDPTDLVDTCGTGGDASGLFNVSTAVAVVVAAAGGKVAKHGNRAVSGKSGSADVLELAGVKLDQSPTQLAAQIDGMGLAFLFAPQFHGAMKHAVAPRKELGIRTMFNLLGPLTNPAKVRRQVLGVFAPQWVQPLAEVLKTLGSERAWVVHSDDGFDELSPFAPSHVAVLDAGRISTHAFQPQDYGLSLPPEALADLQAASPQASLERIEQALKGEGAPATIVALNAAAALWVAGVAADFADGLTQAQAVQRNGAAWAKWQQLIHWKAQ